MRHDMLFLIALSASAIAVPATAEDFAEPDVLRETSARAIVRAGESVDIAAALSARLESAPFKAGRFVKAGEEIARFDCARMRADLAARRQAVETLSLRYDSERELESFGATGALDVAVARSERDMAKAEADALDVTLKDCVITAPFSAHVAERHVSAHETPQVGQPIYTLIRAGSHEISVIVPAALGSTLKYGSTFIFHPDGEDAPVSAKVVRLAPDIDPVSQTREIMGVATSKATLSPGMSGRAVFPPR